MDGVGHDRRGVVRVAIPQTIISTMVSVGRSLSSGGLPGHQSYRLTSTLSQLLSDGLDFSLPCNPRSTYANARVNCFSGLTLFDLQSGVIGWEDGFAKV